MTQVAKELEHIPNLHEADVSEVELNTRLLLEAARIGKFTCSEFHSLMTYEGQIDKLPKGAETVIIEKVSEVLTNSCSFSDSWTNDAMQWGKDHEVEAVQRFTEETGIAVKSIGNDQVFIEYKGESDDILNGNVGGTPDGDINDEVGIEIKCPSSKVHLNYLLDFWNAEKQAEDHQVTLKQIEKKYYWQCQGYMLLTGKKKWFFVSYDPRFTDESKQILVQCVDRSEVDIQRLKVRLEMCVRKRNEILKEMGVGQKTTTAKS